MQDTQDETEESLDYLYFQEQKLITDFNNFPVSKQNKQILQDCYMEVNLFDTHIGLETMILEDNNNCIKRQERVGINSNQQYNPDSSKASVTCIWPPIYAYLLHQRGANVREKRH